MKTTTCSSCGKTVWRGRTSLPQPTCQDCRKRNRQRVCETCGKQYDARPNGRGKYCSRKCAGCEIRRGTCQMCGASFSILSRDRTTFCTRKCSYEWLALDRMTRGKTVSGSCAVRFPVCPCGTIFASRHARKYCSPECAKRASREDAKRKYVPKPRAAKPKTCIECGASFASKSSTAKYCSNRCRKHGRGATLQSRARKHGAARERFGVTEIYERDQWVCGICGDKVDPDSKWPNQMCPSIDHVIPLSMGGSHTRENVRCAHWLCNSLRGATDMDFMIA